MSTASDPRIIALMEQAEGLPDSPTKVALIEEAIRIADSHSDAVEGFSVRKDLMKAATFGGSPEKALVAFTWCIGQCDRDPETFEAEDILWEYKWVVSSLRHFPQITLQQIDDALDDMARRYEKAGLGVRPIHKLRVRLAMHRGDRELAQKLQRRWRSAPIRWGNDCPACEQDDQVDFLIFMGKDDRAVEQAKPIIEGGMSCAEVPHVTYASLLLPLLRLGRVKEAAEHHHRGYPMIASGGDFLSEVAEHLTFLALTGNLDRGVTLLEKHLTWALETMALSRRFDFALAARLLTMRLEEAGRSSLKLRLPKEFPLHREDGAYPVADLGGWFEQDARGLAEQFDKRNETDAFARELAELPGLRQWAVDYPVPKRGKKDE
jgi:hypothetical protein